MKIVYEATLGKITALRNALTESDQAYPAPFNMQGNAISSSVSNIVHDGSYYWCVMNFATSTILRSTDLKYWDYVNMGATITANSVDYCNGILFVTSNSTTYITSSDGGNTWVTRTGPVAFGNVVYMSGTYLASANIFTQYVYTSSNGIDWTARSTGNNSGHRVWHYNDKFFTTWHGGALYSSNGITWSACSGLPSNQCYSICFDGTYYYAGYSSYTIYRSTDGVSFSGAITAPENIAWYNISYIDSKLIIAGINNTYESTNGGTTWNGIPNTGFSQSQPLCRSVNGKILIPIYESINSYGCYGLRAIGDISKSLTTMKILDSSNNVLATKTGYMQFDTSNQGVQISQRRTATAYFYNLVMSGAENAEFAVTASGRPRWLVFYNYSGVEQVRIDFNFNSTGVSMSEATSNVAYLNSGDIIKVQNDTTYGIFFSEEKI